MNFVDRICNLPRALRDANDLRFVKDERLLELAEVSYELCTTWFGIPSDHAQTYYLLYSSQNRCIPPWFTIGPYVISLKSGYAEAQNASVIAHEMYHRVTIKRPGIHRTWWVDEMIAYTLERHAVPELGYPDYARTMHNYLLESPGHSDARTIKEIIAKGILPDMDRKATEFQLGCSIVSLGAQLEALVGWSNVCKIVGCPNWKEWLSHFTPPLRMKAAELLDLAD